MLTALVLAILVSVVAAWAVARSLLRQLGAEPSALANAASQVAHGDLRALPELERAPDGSVAASLAAMRRSLGDVVGQVRDTSSSIASGSSEIAQGNAGLMQRTEAQASSLQQTAASMEEMTGIVQNNAESARQVASLAASASAAAQGGGAVVGQLIVNMNDVSASSHRILDIIGLIDSLAFQTNILALNAAVEAARAGEQGRGFAVVAGEVRNLAQRSATAAKEIKSLIDTSVNKVNEGSRLVDQTGAVMTDIVGQVQRVADLISEISAATLSQTTGITQVSAAVSQLDDATQQNSALAEQSSSAANNLRVEADQLERIVGMFLLESSGALAPASRVAPSEVRRHPRLLHVAVAAHGR